MTCQYHCSPSCSCTHSAWLCVASLTLRESGGPPPLQHFSFEGGLFARDPVWCVAFHSTAAKPSGALLSSRARIVWGSKSLQPRWFAADRPPHNTCSLLQPRLRTYCGLNEPSLGTPAPHLYMPAAPQHSLDLDRLSQHTQNFLKCWPKQPHIYGTWMLLVSSSGANLLDGGCEL